MKKLFFWGLLLVMIGSLHAQEKKDSKCGSKDCQTMMKLQREYIEKNFIINDNQKSEFWEAYNELEKAKFQAFQDMKSAKEDANLPKRMKEDSLQYLSSEQIITFYRIKLETKNKIQQADLKFFTRISQCLTGQQVNQYYQLEKKFKKSAVNHSEKVCSPSKDKKYDSREQAPATPVKH